MTDTVDSFDVFLNEVHVGSISYSRKSDLTVFQLSSGYIEMDSPPILSLSLKTPTGGLNRRIQQTMVKLPPFFSNLLPENEELRGFILRRSALSSIRDFELLGLLRPDLPGAVTLEPSSREPSAALSVSLPFPETRSHTQAEAPIKFSLAGVHLKFSASLGDSTFQISDTGEGGDWIVKLPGRNYQYMPENEFAVMKFAAAVGIETPEVVLVENSSVKGLPVAISDYGDNCYAIRRFDRPSMGSRIHIEDFAQVFAVQPSEKYDYGSYRDIASVIWTETGEPGIEQFIRRLVFSILTGNLDMHLKNWSLIYENPCQPKLSPAYDLMSTVVYQGVDRKLALSLSKTKDPQQITIKHFRYLAAKAKLPEAFVIKTVENTICSTIEHFSEFKRALPGELSQALEQYMMSLLLYPKQVSLSLPQSQQVKTPDSTHSVAAPLDHDQKWLQTELSMEFQRVRPVLEQIKHNLNQYFVLLDWQESPREASVNALYGDNELAISLDFGGWTNTKGRLIELRNSLDVLRVETIRGPHLLVTVSFKQREVLCLAFKYLIYNGRQSWKLLNESSTLAASGPLLDAAGVADFVRAKVVAFLPGTAHSELFNLELDYVTKDLRLIRLKDSSGNVRGTSLLDNKQLADILQETGLTLDGWVNQPGRGLRIGIVDALKAKDLGLFGRSLNDRERERIGKAVIQERMFAALIKANESLPSSAFWLDSGTGSSLIINLKSRPTHTFVVSLREIYGMTSDMSISTSIDSKILTFVRNLDPLYSDAMDILARANADETLPELLDEEILAYLRTKRWVKLDPESNLYCVTSQGYLERLNLPSNYVFKNDDLTDEEVLKIAMQLALSIRNNTDVKHRPDYSMYTRRLRKLIESKAQELKLNSEGKKLDPNNQDLHES